MKKIGIALLCMVTIHIHGTRSALMTPTERCMTDQQLWDVLCEEVRSSLIQAALHTKNPQEQQGLLEHAKSIGSSRSYKTRKRRDNICLRAVSWVKNTAYYTTMVYAQFRSE